MVKSLLPDSTRKVLLYRRRCCRRRLNTPVSLSSWHLRPGQMRLFLTAKRFRYLPELVASICWQRRQLAIKQRHFISAPMLLTLRSRIGADTSVNGIIERGNKRKLRYRPEPHLREHRRILRHSYHGPEPELIHMGK